MNIAVFDDGAAIVKGLTCHLSDFFHERAISFALFSFADSKAVTDFNKSMDIAFIGIQADGFDAIAAGRALKEKNPNILLFLITAHAKYLDDAFELGAFRFLLTPIDWVRFTRALDAALSVIENRNVKVLCADNTNVVLSTTDIVYCENSNRKTKIVTQNGEYFSKDKLREWRSRLDDVKFYSPHASFIVNLNYVAAFDRNSLMLKWGDNQSTVSISAKHQKEFRQRYIAFSQKGG